MAFISVRSLLGTKSQQQPKKTTTNKQTSKKNQNGKSVPVYQEFPAENFKDK